MMKPKNEDLETVTHPDVSFAKMHKRLKESTKSST